MTMQTIRIGKRDFVLLSKPDFKRLAALAERQSEDDYWTNAALEAEAREKNEKSIPLEEIERELDARKRDARADRRRDGR